MPAVGCGRAEEGIPREQGSKPDVDDGVGRGVVGPKREFQENKDRNLASIGFPSSLIKCRRGNSRRTRIETLPVARSHPTLAPPKREFQENKDRNTTRTDECKRLTAGRRGNSRRTRIETHICNRLPAGPAPPPKREFQENKVRVTHTSEVSNKVPGWASRVGCRYERT